ncbi:hypothetical protein [Lactiplantibacillus paraxiangfangensis]
MSTNFCTALRVFFASGKMKSTITNLEVTREKPDMKVGISHEL